MHKKFIVDVVRKKNGWNHFVRIILEKSISQGNAEKNPKKKGETEILFLFKDDKKFFVILNVHIKNRTLFLT